MPRVALDEDLEPWETEESDVATQASNALLPAEPFVGPAHESRADLMRRMRLKVLIEQMMNGTMPLSRPLRANDVEKFSSKHVGILLAYAEGGRTGQSIAEQFNTSAKTVSMVINHPFSEALLTELTAAVVDHKTDPLERIKSTAHEMVNVKLELVRDLESPKTLRNKIASDMLDRAGFAAKREIHSKIEHTFSVPEVVAKRLADVLDESKEVSPAQNYERYLIKTSFPLEGETPIASADLAPGVGHTEESGSASPAALPAPNKVA